MLVNLSWFLLQKCETKLKVKSQKSKVEEITYFYWHCNCNWCHNLRNFALLKLEFRIKLKTQHSTLITKI